MPIRINLLAEARALEELRRKDPVKRVAVVGILLFLLLIAFIGITFLYGKHARAL